MPFSPLPPRPWLLPLVPLYRLVTDLRNAGYGWGWLKSYRAPVPVISVGNLSTGGTGKTPVAEWLLAHWQRQGRRPAYLSRGYGRETQGYCKVPAQGGRAQVYGDEALQVAAKFPALPVAVCADRRAGIRRLVAEERAELIVLDDAFQHRRVARDLDWVVIDAQRLPTQDMLLPAGNLREARRHLRRADLLIVNKVADPEQLPALRRALRRYARPMAFVQPQLREVQPLAAGSAQPVEVLPGQPVILLAGIGHPEAFARQVEGLGARVVERHFFRDHHPFTPQDLARLQARLDLYPSSWLLTTEKDACRLRHQPWMSPFASLPLFYLPLTLHWLAGREEAEQALQSVLSRS